MPGRGAKHGIAAGRAPILAFTDDHPPPPGWAEALLSAYLDPRWPTAGGPVVGANQAGLPARYYLHNPPVRDLEVLGESSTSVAYRLWLYRRRTSPAGLRRREGTCTSLASANISFRRDVLETLGGFDASMPGAGGEDEDICLRLRRAFPDHVLRLVPATAMEHEYDLHLRDALRRARAYGNGNARNYRRHDGWGPTIYPIPVLCGIALLAGVANRRWLLLAMFLPLLLAPRWILNAFRSRSPESLAYAYIQLLQETSNNVGFVGGYLSRTSISRASRTS